MQNNEFHFQHNLFNVWPFLSLQTIHITQSGTAFQMSPLRCLLNLPFQQVNKSTTLCGTQLTTNKERASTQGSQAIDQCNSKWSMDSPSCLHIQHQLTPHCCKISIVRIFLKAADQTKKATLSGAFTFHILFHGNSAAPSPCKTLQKDLTSKSLLLVGSNRYYLLLPYERL